MKTSDKIEEKFVCFSFFLMKSIIVIRRKKYIYKACDNPLVMSKVLIKSGYSKLLMHFQLL